MIDAHTKAILTLIAVALVWLGIQPLVKPGLVRAAADTVRIDGVVQVEAASISGIKVQPGSAYGLDVICVSGCK